jgi:ribosome-associated protein
LPRKKQSESEKLAVKLAEAALSKKATDIRILDLRNLTTISDFFVICTGSSDIHVKAIADNVMSESKKAGERPWHKEGTANRSWILLDYIEVVVHVFLKETRNFYGLEKLWGDADVREIKD